MISPHSQKILYFPIVLLPSGFLKVKLLLPKIDKILMYGTLLIILKKLPFTILKEMLSQ